MGRLDFGEPAEDDLNMLKKAYKALAKMHHPDKDREHGAKLFPELERQYKLLATNCSARIEEPDHWDPATAESKRRNKQRADEEQERAEQEFERADEEQTRADAAQRAQDRADHAEWSRKQAQSFKEQKEQWERECGKQARERAALDAKMERQARFVRQTHAAEAARNGWNEFERNLFGQQWPRREYGQPNRGIANWFGFGDEHSYMKACFARRDKQYEDIDYTLPPPPGTAPSTTKRTQIDQLRAAMAAKQSGNRSRAQRMHRNTQSRTPMTRPRQNTRAARSATTVTDEEATPGNPNGETSSSDDDENLDDMKSRTREVAKRRKRMPVVDDEDEAGGEGDDDAASTVDDEVSALSLSTQHNTTQHTQDNTHNTTQHNTTQHNTQKTSEAKAPKKPGVKAQNEKAQHNTTQHNTTQHNTTHAHTHTHTRTHTQKKQKLDAPGPKKAEEVRKFTYHDVIVSSLNTAAPHLP